VGREVAMADHASFGVDDIDKLMGGGMPPGAYLIEVEPGTGELEFLAAFLSEGLRQGNLCGIVTYDMPHEQIIDRLKDLGVSVREALDTGSMVIADLWTEGKYDPERRGPILMTHNVNDPNSVLRLYSDLAEINQARLRSGRFTGSRVAVLSLSSEIMNYKFEPTYKFVKMALNMVRQHKSRSLATLNPKMFDETVVAAFEHLYDGTIVLTMKNVKGRFQKYIRVKESPISGFYTDEVPYEIVGNRPCPVTSFAEPLSTFRSQLKLDADGSISYFGSRYVLADTTALADVLKYVTEQVGLDIKSADEEIYKFSKQHGRTRFKEFFSSTNIRLDGTDPKSLLESLTAFLSVNGVGVISVDIFTVTNCLCSRYPIVGAVVDPYLAGVLAGVVESLLNRPFRCTETRCMAKGDDYCGFECRRVD